MQEFGVNIVGRCALRRELISNTQWQVMFAQQDREGRKKDNIFCWNAGATPADQTLAGVDPTLVSPAAIRIVRSSAISRYRPKPARRDDCAELSQLSRNLPLGLDPRIRSHGHKSTLPHRTRNCRKAQTLTSDFHRDFREHRPSFI